LRFTDSHDTIFVMVPIFILIVLILFSGCEASTSQQAPYQVSPISSTRVLNSSHVIPASLDNYHSSYFVDYSEDRNLNGITEQRSNSDNRFVLVTCDITNKLHQLRSSVDKLEDMNRLRFSLSGRFNLVLPIMNNGPKIGNDGVFVDRSQNKKIINFDTTDIGRLRTLIPNAPFGKEAFIIDFHKYGEVIPLGFKKSNCSDSYILSSVDYGTERYIIGSQNGLPHLCIYMTQSILPKIRATPFSSFSPLTHK